MSPKSKITSLLSPSQRSSRSECCRTNLSKWRFSLPAFWLTFTRPKTDKLEYQYWIFLLRLGAFLSCSETHSLCCSVYIAVYRFMCRFKESIFQHTDVMFLKSSATCAILQFSITQNVSYWCRRPFFNVSARLLLCWLLLLWREKQRKEDGFVECFRNNFSLLL